MGNGLFRVSRSFDWPVMIFGSMMLVGTLLVGCGTPSTPVGPLRPPLTFSEFKSDQSGAQMPEATQHQATFRLGESQAELRLVWQSIQPQNHAYLS